MKMPNSCAVGSTVLPPAFDDPPNLDLDWMVSDALDSSISSIDSSISNFPTSTVSDSNFKDSNPQQQISIRFPTSTVSDSNFKDSNSQQISIGIGFHVENFENCVDSSTSGMNSVNYNPVSPIDSQDSQSDPFSSLSHPLGMAKHICAICGDRASGKHYGVYSCEGCKGFFKRTVRKELSYTCRENRQCVIDKRQRNRCQYCRYQKCVIMGMKREAVQEERHRLRSDRSESDIVESTCNYSPDMPPERILEAELHCDGNLENLNKANPISSIEIIERQVAELVDWARLIPHFTDLPTEDEALLLHTGWNELILASVAYRSQQDCLHLPNGQSLAQTQADLSGMGHIFQLIATELTGKMCELSIDRTELGCMRAIVLFNPDVPGLKSVAQVESYREKVYACLEEYCRQTRPNQSGRFAKILLRFPSLRSVGIKCLDSINLIPPIPSLSCLVQALNQSIPTQMSHIASSNLYY